MSLLQLFVLSAVQGITEFLPISSSGHLILVPQLTDWPDQGVLIDVAVHVGTLLAVLIYFRRDVLLLLRGLVSLLSGRLDAPGARLALYLTIGTLPVVLVGLAFHAADLPGRLRSAELIGWTTFGFGLVLFLADRVGATVGRIEHLTAVKILLIGGAQALALVPGTSRSGICITAARLLGFERTEAARLAMLLSIPTIVAAGSLGALDVWQSGDATLGADAVIAAALAFATALGAIWAMMRWLRTATYTPFVIYRTLLGGALLAWVYV